jgi:uncharacterized protein (DUF433 family)
MAILQGIIHGKTIELEQAPGLPDGQPVSVEIRPLSRPEDPLETTIPWWLAHLAVDPKVRPGKFVIRGTHLLADTLVEQLTAGCSEQELLRTYPELTSQDVAAVRAYAQLPQAMRRSFGAWAEDAAELDQYLEWTRHQRKVPQRRIED